MSSEVATAVPGHLSGGVPARPGDFLLERRLRLVDARVRLEGASLCDLGCGNGAQTFLFAATARRTVAIDVSRTSLGELRAQAKFEGLTERVLGVCYDGSRIPMPERSVDFATSFEVLEHVEDERAVLAELLRVLKPGGQLALSVPNRWWIFETHGAELPILPWNRVPFFSWLPKPIHDRYARARIYRRREICRLLAEVGFEVVEAIRVTAPMDVLRWRPLQRVLRATLFARDETRIPMLAVSVLVFARRPED